MSRKTPPGTECHHRHPRSRKKEYSGNNINEARNISYLPKHLHRYYHALFANKLPDEIAEILNEHYISPDWELVAVKKK